MPQIGLASRFTSLAQRGVASVRAFGDSMRMAWMGPGTPMQPTVIDGDKPRQFAYPATVNSQFLPRTEASETGLQFDMLRALADPALGGLDLLRLAIETRKDQMAGQDWAIASTDGKTDGGARAREIEQKLRRPDGIHTFRQWQRMILEECFVTDAVIVYALPDEEIAELIDGATMKPYTAIDGRLPMPPEPAWSQVINGIPVTYVDETGRKKPVTWTQDEVISAVRNPRVYRFYGMSPVEQVLGILNLALRRQSFMTSYFTTGNVPDAFLNGATGWTPQQIADYQGWLDNLEGDIQARRRLRVIPHDSSVTIAKAPALKDETDDYISSVIAFALSIDRSALIKPMNRAAAQQSAVGAQTEGLEPIKLWFKDLMDEVLAKVFGADGLEFVYLDEEIPDALKKAQVAQILVNARIAKAGYIAKEWYGLPVDAVPEEIVPPVIPPGGDMPPGGDKPKGVDDGAGGGSLEKKKRAGMDLVPFRAASWRRSRRT